MSIKIITDTSSDILPDNEYGITVLPINILIDGVTYKDGIDITHEEFYNKMVESEELPKTSQINPHDYECAIKELTKDGSSVIIITVSGKLSGTIQSAHIAADGYDNVYIVDSENVSVAQKALVLRCKDLIKSGLGVKAICEKLEEDKKRLNILGLLDTLDYLKKGGRISSSMAVIGGLLSIKPVLSVKDGEVVMVGKSRGSRNGNNVLKELIKNVGGIDTSLPYCLGYTGLSDDLIKKYIIDSKELWEASGHTPDYSTIGGTIGTHTGPGAIAIAFFNN